MNIKNDNIKLGSILVIVFLLLTSFILPSGFNATKDSSKSITTSYSNAPIGSGNNNWSSLQILSEPVIGQNINVNPSTAPRIAVENDKIYVVWGDSNNTNGAGTDSDIFYKYFDGNIWSDIQVISEPITGQNFNTGDSGGAEIAVENGKIYVMWQDYNNTNGAGTDMDIFYRTNLTGSGWEDIQVISEPSPGNNYNTADCQYGCLQVENGKIYAMWSDNNNTYGSGTDMDIYFRCNLTGSSWEKVQLISEPVQGQNINTQYSGSIWFVVENGKIYSVWPDHNRTNGAGSDKDIFFRCNLTGSAWEDVHVISEPVQGKNNNFGNSRSPKIAVENGNIYIAWYDNHNTDNSGSDTDILYRDNITGNGWGKIQVISEPVQGQNLNTGYSKAPKIITVNGITHVFWYDTDNFNSAGNDYDIFNRVNQSGGWGPIEVVSEPIPGKNYNTGSSERPHMAIGSGKLHLVWQDANNTNGAGTDSDIFYRTKSISWSLYSSKIKPVFGNTSTYFNYTIIYTHLKNISPTQISVNISGTEYPMLEVNSGDTNFIDGKDYYFNITQLNIGIHTCQFYASDGNTSWSTSLIHTPIVYNSHPIILTEDNITAYEDSYYEVFYDYHDIDLANTGQLGAWHFSTNASWLAFNRTTAILNGTPKNADVGEYWVNISINDTFELDFNNYTLKVIDVNDRPIIINSNVETTYEDELYEVDYNAVDVDSVVDNQIWSLNTNASSWLDINSVSGIIQGIPENDEVGDHWVNVSVFDGEGGFGFTNFTLSVLNVNDPPEINTQDILIANVFDLYLVDYNATDIDSKISKQTWSLSTNASWLTLDSLSGVLIGTPSISDLGWYNVNVTVNDNNGDFDWHAFILTVIKINIPPELVMPFNTYEMYEDIPVVLEEKLLSMFTDADFDKLTFSSSGQKNIEIEIFQENGTIVLTPDKDWFGTETITFYANDTYSRAAKESVQITVKPINDLPKIVQVGSQVVISDDSNIGFDLKQNDKLNLSIIVQDVDGDIERGMIQVFMNISEKSNLYLLTSEQKLVFHPKNEDVGLHFIKLRITDNNETPPEYVHQDIWFNVLNVNDPPTVNIITPTPNKEFLESDDITFSCEADDPDLLVPTANEGFTYLWYTNKTELDTLGSQEQIIVPSNTLPPGHYTITVMVKDTGGKTAYDFVDIVVKKGPAKTSADSKGAATMDNLWLWILIIAIIIAIICIIGFLISKKKKREDKELGEPQEQVLTPEGAYQPDVSLTLQPSEGAQTAQLGETPQPQVIQPQPVIDSEPLTPTAPQQELPTETAVEPAPTIPAFEQTPQLPPAPEPTVAEPQPEVQSMSESPPVETPPTEIQPEPIQEPITSEQQQPQVQEQEVPQPIPQPTLTPQTTAPAPTQPLMTQCPLCQQQIAEFSNPCPHCGGELVWE